MGWTLFSELGLRRHAKRLYPHIKLMVLFLGTLTTFGIIKLVKGEIQWISLFYDHSSTLASVCLVLLAYLAVIAQELPRVKYLMLIMLAIMVLTFRSKAIGSVVILVMIYWLTVKKKKKIKVKTLCVSAVLAVIIGWEKITFYFVTLYDSSARARLYVTAFQVAKDHFPFGSGFGTYGSHYSGVYYSPLYSKYDLNLIYGLSESSHSYISDTFWPAILGQTGFIGCTAYMIMVFWLFLKIQKIWKINKYQYFSAIGMFVYILIASTSESAFFHPNLMPMAMLLGVLFREKPVNFEVQNIGIKDLSKTCQKNKNKAIVEKFP